MSLPIDIVATRLGPARPVEVVEPGGTPVFLSFPATRFGYPLSLPEYEKAADSLYAAFYAASVGKFPGANPTSMLFGVVAGPEEAFIYDSFGLAAHLKGKKPKLIRKKMRIAASLDDIRDFLSQSPPAPLAPISGKTLLCPACGLQTVRLKTFLGRWQQSGRAYMQMLRCDRCEFMPGEKQWLGSVVCRNCGSRVREDADECSLCGRYPGHAEIP